MNLTGKTETGRRPHNEDTFFAGVVNGTAIAVVSDGMGGHKAGEVASRIAVDTVVSALTQSSSGCKPVQAFGLANRAVYDAAEADETKAGMGATLVLALPEKDRFTAANVGDSRLYLLHERTLRQITHDHSYVAELVRRHIITAEEAKTHPRRNVITRAIGTDEIVRTDVFVEDWTEGDTLLLCSDGLSGSLSESEMTYLLLAEHDLDRACEKLIERAYQNGSTDNITVVLVRNTEDAQ